MVFIFDRDFGLLLDHPPICHLTVTQLLEFMPVGDREHFMLFLNAVIIGRTTVIKKDLQLLTADGTYKWFEFSARLKPDMSAADSAVLEGIFFDISGRRRVAADLNESESWFREVLEESPHAMYRVDYRNNRFDYVSRGFADAIGCSREEILQIPYTKFMESIHPDDMTRLRHDLDQLFLVSGGNRFTYYCEFRFKLKSGKYIWLDDTFTIVPGPDGQYSYQVGFGSVIEDRKQLEEQLRQANEHLEEKVRRRTVELDNANRDLRALIEQRRELEKKLIEISERERRFIGRELHDGLCQQIVGVECMFEALRNRLASSNHVETAELQMIRDLMQDAVMQIRNLSRGLCPISLDPEAVGAALSVLAIQTSVLYQTGCRFTGSKNIRIKNPDAALHIYRIAQEAIQNAIRHGKAQNIEISIQKNRSNLHVVIENDGKPFNLHKKKTTADPGSGLGLKLVDYRVGLLGGSWKIENCDGRVRLDVKAPDYGENLA
jgi:PAS domain S-box-containing protein